MTGASQQKTEEPILCTVRQVADRLSLSRSSVYSLMDGGQLPYVKLGRSRRIWWNDVLRMAESHTVGDSASRN
jgi:excisionase family DNA binding protein